LVKKNVLTLIIKSIIKDKITMQQLKPNIVRKMFSISIEFSIKTENE